LATFLIFSIDFGTGETKEVEEPASTHFHRLGWRAHDISLTDPAFVGSVSPYHNVATALTDY
jgi:hypothetical protein